MDHCARQHGVIATLFLTLKLGLWHCQETLVSFPSINLEIYNDSLHQRLYVEWNISRNAYETSDVMFHIQVARSEKMIIIENKTLEPELFRGRTSFNWTWDSQLPLECDSHSVRIRSAAVGNIPTAEIKWSQWSSWKTHYGEKGRSRTAIYPHERVVLEGSDVTFCCLPGQDQTIQKMFYRSKKFERSDIVGTDSYVISVKNVTMTKSDGGTILCVVDDIGDDLTPGDVLIVSRPPDEPKNFSCVTHDMQSLICSWISGPIYNFYNNLKADYVLHEWLSMKSYPCERNKREVTDCILPIREAQPVYNFTLIARNLLGERSINSAIYLHQRVLLLPPYNIRVNQESPSMITLSWSLRADYSSLQIRCQVKDLVSEDLVNMTIRGKGPTETYKVPLEGLQADTIYNLSVRCMAESSLAGWSNASHIEVTTLEAAPTGALDVWRGVKDDADDKRIVTLYWKPSSVFKANGKISHYTINVQPLEGAPKERNIVSGMNSTQIYIGRQASTISITAHNNAGGSTPAELRIPANTAKDTNLIAERTSGSDGGVYVTWRTTPSAHGYVVEWCAAPRSPHCDLQWKKYNSTVRSDVLTSRDFREGVRYQFRIYGSMEDGDHLLEKKEGYTKELASSKKPNVRISNIKAKSLVLDWSQYPLDGSQEGFVTGYNVYVNDTEKGCNKIKSVEDVKPDDTCIFRLNNPHKMQLTITELTPNGKYEVAVGAITGGGESPRDYKKANTRDDTEAVLHSIIVPIITVSVLALVLLFIGCWKRTWLKRIFLPDIPDPNKSKTLSFNGTKGAFNRHNLLPTNQEPQIVDILRIQESKQHKTYEELTESPDHQLQEIDTKVQERGGSNSDEDFSQCYLPYGNEKSLYSLMNDPSYKSQPIPYLQFCNQTYVGTSEDLSDSVQGYRPQTNTAQVHGPPYSGQSPDSGLELHEDSAVCFNSPVYGSEPISPTSVGSATPILVG